MTSEADRGDAAGQDDADAAQGQLAAPSPVPSPRDHAEAPAPETPPDQESPDQESPDQTAAGKPRPWILRYLGVFSPAGLTGALIFYCLSLTPSLLPRVWYLQAAMSGMTTVIGYGAGVFVGWLARSIVRWRPGPGIRRGAWWALAAATVVLIPLFGVLGAEWQHDIRELTGGGQPSQARYILVELGQYSSPPRCSPSRAGCAGLPGWSRARYAGSFRGPRLPPPVSWWSASCSACWSPVSCPGSR